MNYYQMTKEQIRKEIEKIERKEHKTKDDYEMLHRWRMLFYAKLQLEYV